MQSSGLTTGTVIVTGGCGFIGSHLVKRLAMSCCDRVVVIDKLSYASRGLSRLNRVREELDTFQKEKIEVWTWDLAHSLSDDMIRSFGEIRAIYHLAASTHVDNSILNPETEALGNVAATLGVLGLARKLPSLELFLHFSTDEVYGECGHDMSAFAETALVQPSNPYSASKAASEAMCASYANTYQVPVKTIRCMNVIGLMQDAEKFLPKLVASCLAGRSIGLHCDDQERWGFRGYLSADDAARAAMYVAECGGVGEIYNVPCAQYIDNHTMLKIVSEALGCQPLYHPVKYDAARPGHDIGYALLGDKIATLGWEHHDLDMHEVVRRCALANASDSRP